MQDHKNINYEIQKCNFGQGSIENIKNTFANKQFQLFSDQDHQINLDLRFQSPSIITEIIMRFIGAESFQIILIDTKNQKVQEISKKRITKDQQHIVTPNKTHLVRYAKIRISKNPYSSQKLGIRYIIFKGFNEEVQKKPCSKQNKHLPNNNHKMSDYYPLETRINIKNDRRTAKSKEIFNTRQKSRVIKQNAEKLMDFSQFFKKFDQSKSDKKQRSIEKSQNKPQKKVKLSQDSQNFFQLSKKSFQKTKRQQQRQLKEQTQLAIALSKSVQQTYEDEYEKMQIQKDSIEDQNQLPAELQNYLNQQIYPMDFEEPERTYRTVDFHQDYIDYFSDMSPEWFYAQQKAEIQNNVREEDRLTNKVKIKWLYDTEVYISGFENWRMEQLKHQAKILGCKVIDEVKNHCLAIVPKPMCEKLMKKHKQWKEIKYLTLNYFEDCIQKRQKLNFRKYYLNV